MGNIEKLKVLVTGVSGFVGARIMRKYPTVISVPSDIVKKGDNEISTFILRHTPQVIINAAAISDIGECEKNPEESYRANVLLPLTLAKVCNDIGAKFVSFSSDQVYTGCQTDQPYSEDQEIISPTNIYAKHKLEAEKRVLDCNPNSILLRATWMYDMPLSGYKNKGNFLVNLLNAIESEQRIRVFDFQYRGITYVKEVVDFLDKVITLNGGVYNYGSENTLNTYQTAVELLKALNKENLQEQVLERISKENANYIPHNLWMNCEKIKSNGIFFENTADGFKTCVKDYSL